MLVLLLGRAAGGSAGGGGGGGGAKAASPPPRLTVQPWRVLTEDRRQGERESERWRIYVEVSYLREFGHCPQTGVDAKLQSTRVQTPLFPVLKMYRGNVLRESHFLDSQNIPCATLKRRGSWVISIHISLVRIILSLFSLFVVNCMSKFIMWWYSIQNDEDRNQNCAGFSTSTRCIFAKGGRSANKFRKSHIFKFAGLNNLLY